MNTKKTFGLVVLIILCCGSPAFAEMTQPATSSPLIKHFEAKASSAPMPQQKPAPPAPAPLSNLQLQAAITDLKKSVKVSSTPPPKLTIKKVVLTPNKPMSGHNFFEVYNGNSSVRDNYATTSTQGEFLFFFNTTPGKTYLVDFSLSSQGWGCFGEIFGSIQAVKGHLMAGFTAATSNSWISIRPLDNKLGHFYNVQLILVD